MRHKVFCRDGFRCQDCGTHAGMAGIVLEIKETVNILLKEGGFTKREIKVLVNIGFIR